MSQVEWARLFKITDFHWDYGKTPFSNFEVPLLVGVVYLIALFSAKTYMKERKAYTLKIATCIHNAFLTILSLTMFLGATYGAYLKYQNQGFWAGLVCEQDKDPMKGPLFYWAYIFYLSKFYELLDSFLLAFKKKPLIFLHVYHHFIMPFVCWAGLHGKWCMALWTSTFWNSAVHVFMYYYYTIATLGWSIWWKKHLTKIQIYQFVSGVLYTNIYFYYYVLDFKFVVDGEKIFASFQRGCTGEPWAIVFMFFVNCSFLILFSKWYLDNYKSAHSSTRMGNGDVKEHVQAHGNGDLKKKQ